jgi:hypothetical protein
MATRYWLGKATAVAQVSTAEFATYDVATTRTITIGGVAVSAADSGGTLAAALTAFAVVLNASTHPYFSAITWSSNSTKIIGTADTAGVPFTFAGSVSGGTGTLTNAFTTTTSCTGPNHWDAADNWSGATVPADGDTVIIESGPNICWGLPQDATELAELVIRQTYTGRIGLKRTEFATSADGATTNSAKAEYREDYLTIDSTLVNIGEHFGTGSPAGSPRVKLDLGTYQTTVHIHNTCRTPAETGLPAVRLLMNNVSSKVYVRQAPGGLGIAVDEPTETSTVDTVSVSEASTDTRVHVGRGTTIEYFYTRGGESVLEAAGTVTDITMEGGKLTTEGTYAVTTVTVSDGEFVPNSTGTITTFNINGGSVVATRSNAPRTWTTTTWKWRDASLDLDPDVITLTNKIALAV